MYEIAKIGGYLLTPLTLVLGLGLFAAICLAFRRRVLATALAFVAFAGLWLASTPIVAQALVARLENAFPPLALEATPAADAIVILGGSVAGRRPPGRPHITLNSASSRVWYAAELYRARKAKWIVVAAGGQADFPNEQPEADAISEMLAALGVPASAIRLDRQSRNTRENAEHAGAILLPLGAQRVLLVTSAQHMSRAVKTFVKVWANSPIDIIPAPTDLQTPHRGNFLLLWIPSPNALVAVTKAFKEYAGMAVLGII